MATKRINFYKEKDTGIMCMHILEDDAIQRFEPFKLFGELHQYKYYLKNWSITANAECTEIIVICNSKANKSKERITRFPMKEGSLFLYNSTNDWYCYFRDMDFQAILDKVHIDTIISTYKDDIVIPICCYIRKDGTLVNSTIKQNPTIQYYGNITRCMINRDPNIIYKNGSIMVADCMIEFSKYILIEFLPNHRKLYINKQYNLVDLYKQGEFDHISLQSILSYDKIQL